MSVLEDEIIQIDELNLFTEINKDDYIFLDTVNGTGLIKFSDFVIGTDNITFFDRISGDYLEFSDISAVSATTLTNDTLLTGLTSLTADFDLLNTRMSNVESQLITFVNSISTSEIGSEDISTNINSRIGFSVQKNSPSILSNGQLTFDSYAFQGTGLTDGTDIDLDSSADGFFYKSKGSYPMLFDGNISLKASANQTLFLYIYKNNQIIKTFIAEAIQATGNNVYFNFSFVLNLVEDDKIRIATSASTTYFQSGSFSGTRIA